MNEKIVCKYGAICYRKSEEHLSKYSHPEKNDEETQITLKPDNNTPSSRSSRQNSKSPPKQVDSSDEKIPVSSIREIRAKRSRSGTPKKLNDVNDEDEHVKRTRSKSPSNRDLCFHSPKKTDDLDVKPQRQEPTVPEKRTGKITSFFRRKSPAKMSADPVEKKEDEDLLKPRDTSKMNFMEYMNYSERRDLQVIKNQNKELLKNPHEFIKYRFLVTMPPDFYTFWDWCKEKCDEHPEDIFAKIGFELVGPFDVLAGKFNEAPIYEPGDYLRHYRFFYDTPEFQTIFIKAKTGIHYGYWRDEPLVDQCFIARNDQAKGCQIDLIANNAFSAAIHMLKTEIGADDPNKVMADKFIKELTDAAKEYENFATSLKKRNRKVVCKTFHKAGLVVPFDRKTTVGYRELQSSETELKKILRGIETSREAVLENLQPLITAASIAVDEGDFGNCIELGIDLFCYGSTALHDIILQLLINGYMMVKRPQFLAIMKSHLAKRTLKGNLNILKKY